MEPEQQLWEAGKNHALGTFPPAARAAGPQPQTLHHLASARPASPTPKPAVGHGRAGTAGTARGACAYVLITKMVF